MKVSIIIPTLNEGGNISRLVEYLFRHSSESLCEIIVCDGGSNDDTTRAAANSGAKVLISSARGRALQMSDGALRAKGDILYFVHADTIPPSTYLTDIELALNKGFKLGRYLSSYDSGSFLLKINALLSRLDTFSGMGGDQTLFITKQLFEESGGFNNAMGIMEEFEFCARARKLGKYKIIKKPVLISARKYETNSWYTVQRANYTVVRMYLKGASQEDMKKKYKTMLNYR